MRVCQVIESSSGGSVQVALDLSEGLLAHGDDVLFVYSPLRTDPFFDARRKALKPLPFVAVDMYRAVGLHDLVSLWSLWRVLRRHGPFDVVHAHSSKAGGLVRLLRPFLPRATKIIYTPHAFVTMAGPKPGRFYKMMEWLLSFMGDKVVAVSAGEKDHALEILGLHPRCVEVIPNGISEAPAADREETRALLHIPPNAFLVGFVGRFVPQKNLPRVLGAFALAREQEPRLHLLLLGNADGAGMVRENIKALGLDSSTTLLSDRPARPLMPAFDALLCGSDYEGISLVFLESLMAGVPLIVTPVAGATETVIEGQTGFVAENFTVEALAASLLCWARLPLQSQEKMRFNARQHGAKFSLSQTVKGYRDLYRRLCEEGRGGSAA